MTLRRSKASIVRDSFCDKDERQFLRVVDEERRDERQQACTKPGYGTRPFLPTKCTTGR